MHTAGVLNYFTDPVTGAKILDPFSIDANGNPIDPANIRYQTYFTYVSTPSSIATLLQNGFTVADLVALAKMRTSTSRMLQVGVNQRIRERWQVGGDFVLSKTSGMVESGTQNEDGTTGLEGYIPGSPATGITKTISARASVSELISKSDLSTASLSLTKNSSVSNKALYLSNRAFPRDLWTLDTTYRTYWQNDNIGGKQKAFSPAVKAGYRLRKDVSLDVEVGRDWMTISSALYQPTRFTRTYINTGIRWDL
jgi:hypothetical protein